MMNLIILAHPDFLEINSMNRLAYMIANGMRARGHKVDVWKPNAWFFRLPFPASGKKWLGYLDQYLIFPFQLLSNKRKVPEETLFVFIDNALGPWAPFLVDRPHVVHCNDFLAQRSALGEIANNPVSATGKLYQAFIRWGYRKAKYFISISKSTHSDLQQFLKKPPTVAEVVYLGLNGDFRPQNRADALRCLKADTLQQLAKGYILHVGGNQWYKNRLGVLEAYSAYVANSENPLPLVMAGPAPNAAMLAKIASMQAPALVVVMADVSFDELRALYSLATVLFFPSIAEGFGWPIAEAMACGCPVITTAAAPMTEVGAAAAVYLPVMPDGPIESAFWHQLAGKAIFDVVAWSPELRAQRVEIGLNNAHRFKTESVLTEYERIYLQLLALETPVRESA